MKHIKKALSYSIAGSIGLSVVASLNGCSEQGQMPPRVDEGSSMQDAGIEQSQFLVIEQTGTAPDTYKVVEKHPTSGPTRAILRDMNGQERFLSEEELRAIAQQEAEKVEAGTSTLTQDPSMHSGGLSLGETILAAAAGALIGGMLANRLMNNSNFQRTQQRYGGGRPTSALSRPLNTSQSAKSKPRSGFFGGSRSGSGTKRSIFGSFGG